MKTKSIKYYTLWLAFIFIVCSLFADDLCGQERKMSSKNKSHSDTYVGFANDSSLSKYIRLDKVNVKVTPNNHCEECLSLEGNLDFKLVKPKDKRYFVVVVTNWRGNEQKYGQNPISFLRNRNGDSTSIDTGGYSEVLWKGNSRYTSSIGKKINNSYFKNDAAKFKVLMKWLLNSNRNDPWEFYAGLFLPGPHSYAHFGILDENSILRFNLSDHWIPHRKSFFLEGHKENQQSIKSNDNNTFFDNTGFMYKFILFSLTDNEVYESEVIENAYYTLSKNEVQLIE